MAETSTSSSEASAMVGTTEALGSKLDALIARTEAREVRIAAEISKCSRKMADLRESVRQLCKSLNLQIDHRFLPIVVPETDVEHQEPAMELQLEPKKGVAEIVADQGQEQIPKKTAIVKTFQETESKDVPKPINIAEISEPFFGEDGVSEAISSIQEMNKANEESNEETLLKESILLKSQKTESKDVKKPIQVLELDDGVQKYELQEVNELHRETYSDPEHQVLRSILEPSLRIWNSSWFVLEKLQGLIVRRNLCQSGFIKSKTDALQVFDTMPIKEQKLQQLRKLSAPSKTWKFKFKDSLEKGYKWELPSLNSALFYELTFSMECFGKETRLPYIRELRRAQFQNESGSSGKKIMLENVKLFGVISSKRVVQVMDDLDRGLFVPVGSFSSAYVDSTRPMGYNTTVSAPHMHATCLQLLEDKLQQGIRALQVGLGIGYLTGGFVLKGGAEGCVGGVDHIFELIDMSIKSVEKSVVASLLKKRSLSLHVGDGRKDWKELAASLEVPYALLDQLKNSGPMVILVRTYFHELNVIDKSENGSIKVRTETSVSNLINQAFDDGLSGLILVEVIMHYKRWSIHKWHEWKIMLKKKRKHSKDWWFKYKHRKRIFSSRP